MTTKTAIILLILLILTTPITQALQPATQISYTILFYYQGPEVDETHQPGETIEGVIEQLPGQTLTVLDEEWGQGYECSLVKWTITDPKSRYETAPLSDQPTSLYNYTNPEMRQFIEETFAQYNTSIMPPEEKMKAVLDWVYTHITYTVGEYPHYPWETLNLGKGDCDDMAVLAVTIARALGVEAVVVTGLLIIPRLSMNLTSGNVSYTIKGVAGHAWIAYRGWNGGIHTVDRLVPMDTVPEERRIVLEFPVNGPQYVNQTKEAVESSKPSTVIISLEPDNVTECPSQPPSGQQGEKIPVQMQPGEDVSGGTEYTIVLAALVLFTFTLAYILWKNVRKAYLSFY